jgi:hypothetical protein
MARSSDVLPAPDGPTTSSDSPSGTCARTGARRHQQFFGNVLLFQRMHTRAVAKLCGGTGCRSDVRQTSQRSLLPQAQRPTACSTVGYRQQTVPVASHAHCPLPGARMHTERPGRRTRRSSASTSVRAPPGVRSETPCSSSSGAPAPRGTPFSGTSSSRMPAGAGPARSGRAARAQRCTAGSALSTRLGPRSGPLVLRRMHFRLSWTAHCSR